MTKDILVTEDTRDGTKATTDSGMTDELNRCLLGLGLEDRKTGTKVSRYLIGRDPQISQQIGRQIDTETIM